MNRFKLISILALVTFCFFTGCASQGPVGMFQERGDVGKVALKGSTGYNEAAQTYTITGIRSRELWMPPFGKPPCRTTTTAASRST